MARSMFEQTFGFTPEEYDKRFYPDRYPTSSSGLQTGEGTLDLPEGLVAGRMDLWDPIQWNYLRQLASGELYGPGAATSYFNQAISPQLARQAAEAQGTLKQTYGPMSLGSPYKVAANKLTQQLAEERAQQLAQVLWNWKQMEAQAMARIPDMSPYANIITRAPTSGGAAGSMVSMPSFGGGSSLNNPGIGVGGGWSGSGSSNTQTPNIDTSSNLLSGDNYFNWDTLETQALPASSGNASEIRNPFTGEVYNYSPGGYNYSTPTVNTTPNLNTVAASRTTYEPEEDYDYSDLYNGFW